MPGLHTSHRIGHVSHEAQVARVFRIGRFLTEADRRYRGRLLADYTKWVREAKRGNPTNPAHIAGMTLHYGDPFQFRITFREIFIGRTYELLGGPVSPQRILDAGANIGLATLFFAREYPGVEIHAFEPSSAAFEMLERNVADNQINAQLHRCAVGPEDGEAEFFYLADVDGDIGHSASRELRDVFEDPQRLRSHAVIVKSIDDLLLRGVDILKLDIEGGEGALLPAIASRLANVKNLVMEFHHIPGTALLGDTLNILEGAGHHYTIAQPVVDNAPGAVVEIRSTLR